MLTFRLLKLANRVIDKAYINYECKKKAQLSTQVKMGWEYGMS